MRGRRGLAVLIALGALKLPIERNLSDASSTGTFPGRRIQPRSPRKNGQLGFIAG